MKYIYGVLMLVALGLSFWVIYNQGWLDKLHDDKILGMPIDQAAFDNVKEKCGILETDAIRTTSLRKISDCLDRLSLAAANPVVKYQLNTCIEPEVTIIFHGTSWHIPRDNRTYNFDLLNSNEDECHAWCRS